MYYVTHSFKLAYTDAMWSLRLFITHLLIKFRSRNFKWIFYALNIFLWVRFLSKMPQTCTSFYLIDLKICFILEVTDHDYDNKSYMGLKWQKILPPKINNMGKKCISKCVLNKQWSHWTNLWLIWMSGWVIW